MFFFVGTIIYGKRFRYSYIIIGNQELKYSDYGRNS